MPKLFINEEYGYREWFADLTDAEWEDLKRRWRTMRGLTCLVPVTLIVPQAKPVVWEEFDTPGYGTAFRKAVEEADFHAHVHEHDDSRLGGVDYEIPPTADESFEIDGRTYTREMILALMHAEREEKKTASDLPSDGS